MDDGSLGNGRIERAHRRDLNKGNNKHRSHGIRTFFHVEIHCHRVLTCSVGVTCYEECLSQKEGERLRTEERESELAALRPRRRCELADEGLIDGDRRRPPATRSRRRAGDREREGDSVGERARRPPRAGEWRSRRRRDRSGDNERDGDRRRRSRGLRSRAPRAPRGVGSRRSRRRSRGEIERRGSDGERDGLRPRRPSPRPRFSSRRGGGSRGASRRSSARRRASSASRCRAAWRSRSASACRFRAAASYAPSSLSLSASSGRRRTRLVFHETPSMTAICSATFATKATLVLSNASSARPFGKRSVGFAGQHTPLSMDAPSVRTRHRRSSSKTCSTVTLAVRPSMRSRTSGKDMTVSSTSNKKKVVGERQIMGIFIIPRAFAR